MQVVCQTKEHDWAGGWTPCLRERERDRTESRCSARGQCGGGGPTTVCESPLDSDSVGRGRDVRRKREVKTSGSSDSAMSSLVRAVLRTHERVQETGGDVKNRSCGGGSSSLSMYGSNKYDEATMFSIVLERRAGKYHRELTATEADCLNLVLRVLSKESCCSVPPVQ